MEIQIKILNKDDIAQLSHVNPGVFDNRIDPLLAAEFLRDPRHHLAVAVHEGRVVGFASAVHYIHPDKPAELWINEVGVAATYRNQGIGKGLLRCLLALAGELKCKEAWVLTDPGNENAKSLYSAVGGKSNPQVLFSFAVPD